MTKKNQQLQQQQKDLKKTLAIARDINNKNYITIMIGSMMWLASQYAIQADLDSDKHEMALQFRDYSLFLILCSSVVASFQLTVERYRHRLKKETKTPKAITQTEPVIQPKKKIENSTHSKMKQYKAPKKILPLSTKLKNSASSLAKKVGNEIRSVASTSLAATMALLANSRNIYKMFDLKKHKAQASNISPVVLEEKSVNQDMSTALVCSSLSSAEVQVIPQQTEFERLQQENEELVDRINELEEYLRLRVIEQNSLKKKLTKMRTAASSFSKKLKATKQECESVSSQLSEKLARALNERKNLTDEFVAKSTELKNALETTQTRNETLTTELQATQAQNQKLSEIQKLTTAMGFFSPGNITVDNFESIFERMRKIKDRLIDLKVTEGNPLSYVEDGFGQREALAVELKQLMDLLDALPMESSRSQLYKQLNTLETKHDNHTLESTSIKPANSPSIKP